MKNVLVVLMLILALGITANASQVFWSENFENLSGQPSPSYYDVHQALGASVGIAEESGTGNHFLKIDTLSGDYGFVNVLMDPVRGMDGSKPITVTFRCYLFGDDQQKMALLGTSFIAGLLSGGQYTIDGVNAAGWSLPVNQWVNMKYEFSPETGTTHRIWVNDEYKGEYTNYPALTGEQSETIAFFIGDNDDPGDNNHGVVGWDDFSIAGTPAPAPIPEPSSLMVLGLGISGLAAGVIRRRS